MGGIGAALAKALREDWFAKIAAKWKKNAAHADDAGHFQECNCLNCGAHLNGSYCHQCGQKAHLHRSLRAFLYDLLHGALHFEGRTWRTLPLLLWSPGQLTRRYVQGERARFVSPMALFLFSIFLMFAVFQTIGLTPQAEFSTIEGMRNNAVAMREKLAEDKAELTRQLATLPAGSASRAQTEAQLADITETIAGLDLASQAVIGGKGPGDAPRIETGFTHIDHSIEKWRKNPGLMLYKLQSYSYKFSWLLVPLSIPFLWLLFFWKREIRAYDHAIFVTYSIAFMSLLFVGLSVLFALGAPINAILLAAVALPAAHLYKHMRGAYRLSRISAIWRLLALAVFIAIVLALFLQILLVLGAM